jgi:DNA-binding NtrC family response regulator
VKTSIDLRTALVVSSARVKKAPMTADQKPGTILLVDDERHIRNVVRAALEADGYYVLEAADGEEGMKVAEACEVTIHLLLTDIVMPKKTGQQLAEYLEPLCPGIKVVYMTGHAQDVHLRRHVVEKGYTLIEKPFMPSMVARKVGEILAVQKKPNRKEERPLYRTVARRS